MPGLTTVPDKTAYVDNVIEAMWDVPKDDLNYLVDRGADVASAAVMAAPTNRYVKITGVATVNTIGVVKDGAPLILEATSTPTLKDGTGNLILNGDYAMAAGDRIMLVCDGTNWFEVCRHTFPVGETPWLIEIVPFMTPIATVGFVNDLYSGMAFNAAKRSGGLVNEEIEFDVVLSAGTWTISLLNSVGPDRGIATIYLDGVSVGTADLYAAAGANSVNSVTGVVVATSGKKRLKIKMATKNASSTAYYAFLNLISLRRTA